MSLPDLPLRLLALLDREAPNAAVVLVGGGAAVDVVRDWNRQHTLSDQDAHNLALSAMTLNAQMLITAHPRFCAVTNIDQVAKLSANDVAVLIPNIAIHQLETTHAPLPRSWSITSDSIAAWLAAIYDADLWLLKSVNLPKNQTASSMTALADAGLVDSSFPEGCSGLARVSWCNLQADSPTIQRAPIEADTAKQHTNAERAAS